jgi:hypothetical protein
MTNDAHHGTYEVHPVPRRAKHVHLAELYEPVYALPSRNFAQRFFFPGIADGQAQGLHRSIKVRNRFQKVVDEQHG